MTALAVFYLLHLTLNKTVPYIYAPTGTDGQAGLGDALISFASFIAYPVGVLIAASTLYREGERTD
jgi:hypothetical protein